MIDKDRNIIYSSASPDKVADDLENEPNIELCHRPDTGILCVRVVPQGFPVGQLDNLQKYVYESIKKEGKRSISMTQLNDKTVLRLVAISPCVTSKALMETISVVQALAKKYQESYYGAI